MLEVEAVGCGAVWSAKVCDATVEKTMCGIITPHELDHGVDLDDFVDALASRMPADCDVDLQLMLPGRETIEIAVYVNGGLAEIDAVVWGVDGLPSELTGRWLDFDWGYDG
jgi:hypothetical protein